SSSAMSRRYLLAIVITGCVALDASVSAQGSSNPLAFTAEARAVAVVRATTLTDRNGQIVPGRVAVVASGDTVSGGRLRLFDVSTPTSPALLGSAQLTAVPGQPTPPGVPDLNGTPRHVVVTPDGRALVSIEGVGLVSVRLGQMIPDDPAHPGAAIGARFPASGSADITQAALLGG